MRSLASSHFSVFSAGIVVVRLFSSSFVSSPLWSLAAALAPTSRVKFGSVSRRGNGIKCRTLGVAYSSNQRGIHYSVFPATWLRTTALCGVDSNVDFSSTGICYDSSVLRFLGEEDAKNIDFLVQERSKARWQGNYTIADDLKTRILNLPSIPSGYELVLKDISRNEGGGSRWNLVHTKEIYDDDLLSGSKILQLAHTAMGLAVENNQQNQTLKGQLCKQKSLEDLAEKAKSRLKILQEETRAMDQINSVFEVSTKNTMVQSELGGRTAADAALWFAFAGSKDQDLFDSLADIASWELQRFGKRPSFRSKYALQIAERFAAAGLRRHEKLEKVVGACLSQKQQDETDPHENNEFPTKNTPTNTHLQENGESNQPAYLKLHSDRSLLLIWKLATKQKKQRAFLRSVMENLEQFHDGALDEGNYTETMDENPNVPIIEPSYDWNELFEDASRPLVVDVGCGMGVSLLGLASTNDQLPGSKESSRLLLDENLNWSECNFAGVDLGALGIEYARGVAHRWGTTENLHFAIGAAEDVCRQLESYPGEVRCCMIQFPTPFRLKNKGKGNSQLPASQLEGFMVTKNLLETIRSSLHPTKGKLLLQSNCEDVAVWMRNLACKKAGFVILDDEDNNKNGDDAPPPSSHALTPQRIPQRTTDWINMGGERAEGRGWYQREVLHRKGATETEVACAINVTPVHRCILKVSDESESIL